MRSDALNIRTRPPGRVSCVWRAQLGYTIVELVVVMVLLGILAASAMPRFFAASRFEEMGFADSSAGALRFAQKLALSSGCDTGFSIGPTGYALLLRATRCDAGDFTRAVMRPGGAAWEEAAPAGVSVGSLAVFFDAQGRPFDTATGKRLDAVITYMVGSRTLAIEPETGFVH